jgi:hypothetical protein
LRASVTIRPVLFGPSPEISITRRSGSTPLSARSLTPKSMAPEIEVENTRPMGVPARRAAKARAPSGPSITVQGTTTFCSAGPDHST